MAALYAKHGIQRRGGILFFSEPGQLLGAVMEAAGVALVRDGSDSDFNGQRLVTRCSTPNTRLSQPSRVEELFPSISGVQRSGHPFLVCSQPELLKVSR